MEQVGEGGMGAVWMAQQTEPLKRLVAVKLIKGGMDSRQVIARFEAERQALALMDHPSIAKVLDAGTTASGRPYFVMELVKGVPITRYCDEQRLTPQQRLELFIPVCLAVQHAHQKGIIHRDIKPSNVLVAQYDGRPVPKVIDFGIAKATGQQLTEHTLETGAGAVVGTLEYMSPEQAELNQLDIDTRSDVYSLGVLLYELLTGTTPLEKKRLNQAALLEVLRVIREEEPPRPSTRLSESKDSLLAISAQRQTEAAKLTRLVRGELDWIVMKALEKDRGRRYDTANGFAADIGRYLADEPVQACPPSAWYKFRKFARRHRAGLTTGGAFVGVLVILALTGLVLHTARVRAEEEAKEAERERKEQALTQRMDALHQEKVALEGWKQSAYFLRIGLAFTEYRADNVPRADQMLDECPTDLRHWEWHYLKRLCHSACRGVPLPVQQGLRVCALQPDGRRAALVYRFLQGRVYKNLAQVFDVVTGKEVASLPLPDTWVSDAAAFSPDGRLLAVGGDDMLPDLSHQAAVHVWDLSAGMELHVLRGITSAVPSGPSRMPIWGLEFNADGSQLAAADWRGNLYVWDLNAGGKERLRIPAHHLTPTPKPNQVWYTRVAFSRDGARLASVCEEESVVKVWDGRTGKSIRELGRGEGFSRVVFSPKGGWAAAAGQQVLRGPDLSVRLWDLRTERAPRILGGHSQPVTCLAFSPDETRLVTASGDRTVRLWDVLTGKETGVYRGHTEGIRAVAFSGDGRQIVTLDSHGVVKTWDGTRGPEARLFPGGRGAWSAALAADGRRVAAACLDGRLRIWDTRSGQEVRALSIDPSGSPQAVAFSPDGDLVAGAFNRSDKGLGPVGGVRVWSVATGELVRTLPDPQREAGAPSYAMAWSTDGKLLACGGRDRAVRVWDAATGEPLCTLAGHARTITGVAFSADGHRLASASGGLSIHTLEFNPRHLPIDQPEAIPDLKVWDVASGKELLSRSLPDKHRGLAISPDGEIVAATFLDGSVRLYRVATGEEVIHPLKGHTEPPWGVAFSPDGRRIVTAGGESIKLWDAQTGQEIITLTLGIDTLTSVGFSPDGQQIVASAWDGVRVWNTAPLPQ
jgi:WD40 repeat protein